MEVLNSIISYIWEQAEGQIAGVIYLHRITDRRVYGSSQLNLSLLRALCGEQFYRNVVLATTMWGTVPRTHLPDLESREAELNGTDVFWGDMLEKEANYSRYNNTAACGREIVGLCLAQQPVFALKIILEMQQNFPLEKTSAGQVLTEELRKREEREREELMKEQEAERQDLQRRKVETEMQLRAMQNEMPEQREMGHRRRMDDTLRPGDEYQRQNQRRQHQRHSSERFRRPVADFNICKPQ